MMQHCSVLCAASLLSPALPLPLTSPCRFRILKQWAKDVSDEALSCVEVDMASFGYLTAATARKASVFYGLQWGTCIAKCINTRFSCAHQ